MTIHNLPGAISLAIAAALGAPSRGQAQILAVATMEGTYTQRINNSTWQAIHIGVGSTVLHFNTTKNSERIVITYSAYCLAGGFIIYARATVDGLIASPGATTGVSLCSTAVSGSLYPASRTFSVVVATKGVHNLSIEVKGNGAAILIGESALVVQN